METTLQTPEDHHGTPVSDDRPASALKRHYDAVMKQNLGPLFETFETYKSSLPVRQTELSNPPLILVDLPFFARQEDLDVTTKRLEFKSSKLRSQVKYAVSPTCTGKTASICPAFLRSAASSDEKNRFSHYLYMAFSNNGGKMYSPGKKSDISNDCDYAEVQGAAFMVNCLENLLRNKFGRVSIPKETELEGQTFERYAEICQKILDDYIPSGRILIHVDEHREMAPNHPNFRRGALSVIAHGMSRATVVATYVDVPTEIAAEKSSKVCRFAVPVPVLDINAAIRYAGCHDNPQGLDRTQQRFLATLKFRLAAHLSENMTAFHFAYSLRGEEASPTKKIKSLMNGYAECVKRKAIQKFAIEGSKEGSLMDNFLRMSTRYKLGLGIVDEDVMKFFLGVRDFELNSSGQSLHDSRVQSRLVSITNRTGDDALLAYGLEALFERTLHISKHGARAFAKARSLFLEALTKDRVPALMSGSPLERAYLWSLTTMACHYGIIALSRNEQVFNLRFQCEMVKPGRIFSGSDMTMDEVDVSRIEENTMYYVHEGVDGKSSHPLGDIFFLSDDDELVLIDVTASMSSSQTMTKKRRRIKAFFNDWNQHPPKEGLGLLVAIVNPLEMNVRTAEASDCSALRYIYGEDARELLGGLVQFLAWYN